MKASDHNKWLDDILTKAIGSESTKPNFGQWRQDHRQATEALRAHGGRRERSYLKHIPIMGRNIMKNKIAQLAGIAAAIVVVMVGVYHFAGSIDGAKTAWAIEQTIEAMEHVHLVHFSGPVIWPTGTSYTYELWGAPNDEGTESSNIRCEVRSGKSEQLEQLIVVHNDTSYEYHPSKNTAYLRPGKQMVINPWVGSKFFERLKETSGVSEWNVAYGRDEETGRASVFVTCSYEPMERSWWFQFDQDTKLLVRFKQWQNLHRQGQAQFEADKIAYDEAVPNDFFIFKIPDGAKVIQVKTPLDDPVCGTSAEGMTQAEASSRICKEYWQALIDHNFGLAHKLRPLLGEKDVKNPPKELIQVGEPYQQEGCTLGPVTPCTVKFEDGQVREVKLIIKFRNIDGVSSCVIVSTWGE